VLEDLAAVAPTARAAATGTAHAAALLGAAEAIREAIGTVIPPCERAQHEETVSGAQAVLGAEAFAAAWQRGRLAQPDDLAEPEPGRTARAAGSPASAPASAEVPADPGCGEGTLVIRALGAATVRLGDGATLTSADWGYAKPRELLFLLATSPPLTREQIGAALWPDASRQQLGNALHTALRELRHALGDPAGSCTRKAGTSSTRRDRGTATSTRSRPPSPPPARRARRRPPVMDLRLPLAVEVRTVVPAVGLVLIMAERLMAGTGPDGQPVRLRGLGCTVVRPQSDATWRIAADVWCLAACTAVAATADFGC
jgi:hypothetical protein